MNNSITHFSHNSGSKKFLAGLLVLLLSAAAPAQEETPAESPVELPAVEHLAASLSDETSRAEALLSMVVVDHLLEDAIAPGQLEERWQDERAWLDRLAARFPMLPLRSSALDAASWFVLLESDRHRITPSSLVSPQGPDTAVLIRQLFDRADERLSAALLPDVLMRMEYRGTGSWQSMLSRAAEDDEWLALAAGIGSGWAQTPVGQGSESKQEEESSDPIRQALESFQVLAASVMHTGAPDTRLLQQLRYRLLKAMPEMDDARAGEAAQLLRLATAVDGLHENRYLSFAETLLWVVMEMLLADGLIVESGLIEASDTDPDSDSIPDNGPEVISQSVDAKGAVAAVSELPQVLVELLPQLSNAFARNFSDTDPHINSILAAAFEIVQNLQSGSLTAATRTYLIRELADAVARLVLMIPDMNFYFDQPVRNRITREINNCTGIVTVTGPDGEASQSRRQFDRCLASLAELSDTLVRRAELAGDPNGPFGTEQLRRELRLTPWQRINYALGYLHDRYNTACGSPEDPLPNPLEWAALATSVAWFAEQSPVYFQTPANEALVVRMRQQGMDMLQAMEQQVDCYSGSGSGINDPVQRSLAGYRRTLDTLAAGINQAELVFRQARLAPGSDIVLSGDAYQKTAYRTSGLTISPCQADRVCEMNAELESTRALIGLFPNHYLVAEQAGLGKIEICYDNMSWVQRRSEPTRRGDDSSVADYYGRLSFDLIGRYVEDGVTSNIFGSNFISPDEYHYLFAAASDEVLNDRCPTERIGSKIVTRLRAKNGFRVIPDRLTYLASARRQPSQVVSSNWSQGAEWRDWFVTGLGVTPFEFHQDETIRARIDHHLKALYQAEQSMLYRLLLQRPSRNSPDSSISLYNQMTEVDTAKTLVRFHMSLFYPDMLIDSDAIRGFLEGTGALLDGAVLRRFRESNMPVESINNMALKRLADFQAEWTLQAQTMRRTGSVALSVAHAITRLNALYQAFFALPPSPAAATSDEIIKAPDQL